MSEIEIDTDLVRALLRDQHPDLAELELRWGQRTWGPAGRAALERLLAA